MSSANKNAKWDCLSEPSASPVQSQDLADQFGLKYEALIFHGRKATTA